MRSSKAALVLLLLLCLVSPSSLLIAQTATGQANGTVTDQSGAFVPGATVSLTNQATGIENRATTSESGYYIFINVQPGVYKIRAEKGGFKTAETPAFQIAVNQAVTQPISLGLGTASEVVQVSAESTLIDSTTTELGTVIPEKAVNDLPLNGRNFTQLLTLTPGATPVSTSQNRTVGCCEGNVGIPGSGFADPSFHGQENRSKLYFYDGIINTNIRGPTYIVIPNIDSIQEFKVVGHDSKSEFGGASGGVVNIVSKPGTDRFHGSAFEYVRNNFFDARDTFGDGTCTAARCKPGQVVPSGPAAFHQNQFGAVVTGPIIKNKTFFSAGYDGWRYSKPGLDLAYVPTAAELSGDFSKTSFTRQLFNPYSTNAAGTTRDNFRCDTVGNPITPILTPGPTFGTQPAGGTACAKIPQQLIFTPMQQFFQKYSATPNFSDPRSPSNFIQTRPTINNSNSFTGRIDHHFRDADTVFFRYTEQRNTVFSPIGEVDSTSGGSQGRNYGGGWVHAFSANAILDVRAGYAGRPGVDAGQQNKSAPGLDPLKQQGFVDVDKYGGLLVRLNTNDWKNGNNNDFGQRGDAPRENPNWSVTPNLTWLKGTHNFKVGAWYIEAKRIQLNTFQRYTFSDAQTRGLASTQNTTGLSLASALLGFTNDFQAQLPIAHGGPVKFKYASWAGYLQDEWRLRPTMTLTYGLRYDYLTQPETLDGRLWNALDIPNKRWIIGAKIMPALCSSAKQSPCIPDAFLNDAHFSNVVLAGKRFFAPGSIKDNWGPRVGFAWSIRPKTVIRTGYGLYWDALPARSQYAQNDLELAIWPDATAFAGTANTPTAFGTKTQANIIQLQQLGFATPLPTTNPWTPANTFGDDPKYKDSYSHQWNLEVQQELTPTTMFSIAYVGSKNGRMPYSGSANTANQASRNPCATTDTACNNAFKASVDALRPMPWVAANINYTQSIGYSHYHGLQSKLQRRFANGLQSLVSYTWSKSTDVGSGYFNVENGPGGGTTVQNYYDMKTARGVSSYDITHFFSWFTVYELPFGRGKTWLQSGPASWFLGNWQANYILQARSGEPYNLQVTGDLANIGGSSTNAPGNYLRPNVIADPFTAGPVAANPDPNCQKTISQNGRAADAVRVPASWFNPCAFGIPIGQFGNLGRNAFRGPHVVNMDFSLFKSLPLPREGMNLQLRFEAFNLFNIQNYGPPQNANLTLNTNATTTAVGVGRITTLAQGTTPRQLQFGLRFVF